MQIYFAGEPGGNKRERASSHSFGSGFSITNLFLFAPVVRNNGDLF